MHLKFSQGKETSKIILEHEIQQQQRGIQNTK